MAHVIPHRGAGGSIVPAVFDRLETEGDAARFYTAEAGQRLLLHVDSTDLLDTGAAYVTAEGGGTYLLQLPFRYLVGSRQLQVYIAEPTAYAGGKLLFIPIASTEDRNKALLGWTGPSSGYFQTWFEEVSSASVRVYGVTNPPGVLLFVVPHTSLPAAHRNKVTVNDQGDNEAVELLGDGDGVVLRSPNGRRWLVRADDSGNLVSEPR